MDSESLKGLSVQCEKFSSWLPEAVMAIAGTTFAKVEWRENPKCFVIDLGGKEIKAATQEKALQKLFYWLLIKDGPISEPTEQVMDRSQEIFAIVASYMEKGGQHTIQGLLAQVRMSGRVQGVTAAEVMAAYGEYMGMRKFA